MKRENYDTVSETVGLVPSLRRRDNIVQGVFVGAVTLAAALAGAGYGWQDARPYAVLVWSAVGAVAGLVASGLTSGLVLMVVGWVRALRRVR